MLVIDEKNLPRIARNLAKNDSRLHVVVSKYGPPPLWSRQPGFATLLQIILEQQVSLASAKACFDKLSARIGSVTPELLLNSSDLELRADGFSRQKLVYARHLADNIMDGRLDLDLVAELPDQEARLKLITLKGIGNWTSDIYL